MDSRVPDFRTERREAEEKGGAGFRGRREEERVGKGRNEPGGLSYKERSGPVRSGPVRSGL